MDYTIEQFEIDFENSYTVESKREVLEKALKFLNITLKSVLPKIEMAVQKYF